MPMICVHSIFKMNPVKKIAMDGNSFMMKQIIANRADLISTSIPDETDIRRYQYQQINPPGHVK